MKNVFSIFFIIILSSTLNAQNWATETTFPGNLPDKRQAGISAVVDNNLYFGLGISNYTIFKDFWRYNSITKIWTQLPDFPGAARYDAVSFVIGTNIFVGTGDITLKDLEFNTGNYTRDIYIFNTLTNTWSRTTDLPISIGEAIAFTINGKGYITCGKDTDGVFHRELFCFDPANSTWIRKADFIPTGRSYPIGFSVNGKGYVGGGYRGSWILDVKPTMLNDFWQYDPNGDAWTNRGQTFNGGSDGSGNIAQAVCVSSCNRGYIISGRTTNAVFPPSNTAVSEYDPNTNSWTLKASIPSSLDQGSGGYISGKLYAGLGLNASIYSLNLFPVIATQLPVCSASSFTVSNLLPGSTVTWQSSNSNGLTIDQTLGNAYRVNNFNGSITVTATINTGCETVTSTKDVGVGNYTPIGISSYQSNCSGNTFNVLNTNLSSACSANTAINFSYQITDPNYSNLVFTPVSVPSGASWSFSGRNLYMTVTTPSSRGSRSETIALSATGPCGNYNVNFTSTAVNYSSFFAMSPNPSKGNVTVSLDNENAPDDASQSLIYAIQITDKFGTPRGSFEYKEGINSINISLQDLNSGTYLLSVFDGKTWSSKQLMVQR